MDVSPRTTRRGPRPLWVVGQTALVAAGVLAYFGVRGLTSTDVDQAQANARAVIELEQWLSIYVEAAVQAPVAALDPARTFANWIYIWGHWPVIVVTLAWLALHHRGEFLRLRDAMMMSGAVGMVVFALFPVAPPRLAGLGLVDTVTAGSNSYRVLQPPAFVNQYAAMPSLHVGWDLLVGIAIVTAASSWILRILGLVLPALMAVAVVATANHYLLDVVAGVAIVLVARSAASVRHRRRRRPRPLHRRGDP